MCPLIVGQPMNVAVVKEGEAVALARRLYTQGDLLSTEGKVRPTEVRSTSHSATHQVFQHPTQIGIATCAY